LGGVNCGTGPEDQEGGGYAQMTKNGKEDLIERHTTTEEGKKESKAHFWKEKLGKGSGKTCRSTSGTGGQKLVCLSR